MRDIHSFFCLSTNVSLMYLMLCKVLRTEKLPTVFTSWQMASWFIFVFYFLPIPLDVAQFLLGSGAKIVKYCALWTSCHYGLESQQWCGRRPLLGINTLGGRSWDTFLLGLLYLVIFSFKSLRSANAIFSLLDQGAWLPFSSLECCLLSSKRQKWEVVDNHTLIRTRRERDGWWKQGGGIRDILFTGSEKLSAQVACCFYGWNVIFQTLLEQDAELPLSGD